MPSSTKLSILESSILFFQVLFGFTFGNNFVIDRATVQNPRDSFTIPSSLCNRTSSTSRVCESYHAKKQVDASCSCHCSVENSTFFFDENNWGCVADSKVRKLQDCGNATFFKPEESATSPGPLKAISVSDGVNFPLDIPFGDPNGWAQCELNVNSSWFLGCNGSRLQSIPYMESMKDLFSFTPFQSSSFFSLEIRGDVHPTQLRLLPGKIVNLGIRCNSNQHQYHACLMFKVSGEQTCPVTVLNPQTSPALKPYRSTVTGSPSLTGTPSLTRAATHVTASISSFTIARPITMATWSTSFASPSPTLTESSVTLTESISFSPTVTVNSNPNSGVERPSNNGSYSRGLMAGMTVTMVLVLLNIAGCLIYHRRRYKKRKIGANSEDNRDGNSMSPQCNPVFQWDDEIGYEVLGIISRQQSTYASMYRLPRCSDAKREHPCPGNSCASEKIIDGAEESQEPFHHKLEQPTHDSEKQSKNNAFTSSEQPVYRFVEELITSEGHKRPTTHEAEPVYHVLEHPEFKDGEAFTTTSVVKGPSDCKSKNEPLYYVLERDSCPTVEAEDKSDIKNLQEPVYSVLEGPE